MSQATLITGFPNLSSRLLVRRLLDDEQASDPVFLLVPPAHEASAREFLSRLGPVARRVVLLEGRAGAIDLGLSGEEYKSLTRRVRVVHHTAITLAPNTDRRSADEVNIGGARELIEFGRAAYELERIVFHSSALVAGDRSGVILESELAQKQGFHCPAERALAGAELMLQRSADELPISVLRPSLLAGNSRTGEIDRDSPLAQLLALLLRAPADWPVFMPGTGATQLNLVPTDFVIDAALAIAERPDAVGKVFHLTDPEPPRIKQVFDWVRGHEAAGRVRSVPSQLGRALFNAPGPLSWAHTPRMLLELMTTDVTYDCTHSAPILADDGLVCPRFEDYVQRVLSGLRKPMESDQAGAGGGTPSRPPGVGP
jgi:nucleoside-diphosphate-sugar epimerase